MTFTMRPKGTPLPENHPLKGGAIFFGGQKPTSATNEEVAWVEEFFQTAHGRKPNGVEAMALIYERRRKGGRNAKPT